MALVRANGPTRKTMIFDSLPRFPLYSDIHPLFPVVSSFLRSRKLSALPKGRIELGNNVYAIVDEYETEDRNKKFIECHRKFIDVHVVLCGSEKIGVVNTCLCTVLGRYNKEKDFEKLKGPLDFITLKKGYFAFFFPHDGHMPGLKAGKRSDSIKKMVVKIPII
jgi:biofilm protein TabA